MRASLGLASVLTALSLAGVTSAEEPAQPQGRELTSEAEVDLTTDTRPAVEEPAPAEAPPPPYEKTLVLDASVGAMAFLGQFQKVAPPGPWMHAELGYEVLKWLMLYGEGELAFTDTSGTQAPPKTRAFPLFGFGGGARFTARFADRLGVYAQAGLGAMKADIATNALGILGFRNAESLGLYLGSRVGVEWYQLDRHLALGLNAGVRLAQGFAKTGASRDTPAAVDGGVSIRYAF